MCTCSSANFVSVGFISSYYIQCTQRFNQRITLADPVFRLSDRPNCTCLGTLFLMLLALYKRPWATELTSLEFRSVLEKLLDNIPSKSVSVYEGVLNLFF